jgi:FtsP/CotA-like multicopper oxidase with cupredoxin domain
VFVMIEPGGSHSYRYEIPADHPPGMFWYHPHHHGEVAEQVAAGMAGAIVVEAPDGPSGASDRVLVLSDPRVGTDAASLSVTTPEKQMGRQGDAVLVNGAVSPTITPEAGTLERWRILNACASRFLVLSLSSGRLTLVGSDQGALDRPVELVELRLVPGQRAELLVPVGTDPLTLRAATVDRAAMGAGGSGMGGGGMGGGDMMGGSPSGPASSASSTPTALLQVEPAGAGVAPAVVAPTPPSRPDVSRVSATRTVTMGAVGMGPGQFVIDGRSFDARRIDVTADLGTVEEWTITNGSMMDHPFHLHVWPFTVVSRSDGAPEPGWHDTVNVPAGGWVRVRIPFADIGGTTVFHCHILDHEDLGMMATIRVS